MLVSTVSLVHLLKKREMTSEDILKNYWQKEGNLNSLISPDNFKAVQWTDLASSGNPSGDPWWNSSSSALHELKQIICGLMCSVWIRWTRPR